MEPRQAKDDKTVGIVRALVVVVVVYGSIAGGLAVAGRWVPVSDRVQSRVLVGALVLALALAIATLVRRRSQLARSAEGSTLRR